jgi:hypothetical protein
VDDESAPDEAQDRLEVRTRWGRWLVSLGTGLFCLLISLSIGHSLVKRPPPVRALTTMDVLVPLLIGGFLWYLALSRIRWGLIACNGRLVLTTRQITYTNLISSKSIWVDDIVDLRLKWSGVRLETESARLAIRLADYSVPDRYAIVDWMKSHPATNFDVNWHTLGPWLGSPDPATWKEVVEAVRKSDWPTLRAGKPPEQEPNSPPEAPL